jgi:hypothetical protein
MDLIIAHPLGWWALLGLPAVLAIHFLQSRTRREEIATLFLLDPLAEESRRGAVWTRLRASRQLWLQLLAVLLFTLLLLQPSWLREDSVQSIAVVLDSSRSMQPFRDEAVEQVAAALRRLERGAAGTAWWLVPSDGTLPLLYRGDAREEAVAALAAWRPQRGHHDAVPALRRARALVGGEGLVVWVTDRVVTNLPAGVDLLAVGRPLENAGFTGLRFEPGEGGAVTWVASVLHQGVAPADRDLVVRFDDGPFSAPERLRLMPGRLATVRGAVPPGARRGVLALGADDFPADDAAPFVVPQRKPLFYRLTGFSHLDDWMDRVMRSAEAVYPAVPGGPLPSVVWGAFDQVPPPLDRTGVLVYTGDALAPYTLPLAEAHPLVTDLAWSALLARAAPVLPVGPEDRVLVWAGERPLVVLRENGSHRQLLLGFDPARSNADRLPAVLLTVHRFLDRVRAALPVYEARNLDAGAELGLPGFADEAVPVRAQFEPVDGGGERVLPGPPFRAPDEAGWLRVTRGEVALLDAGVLAIDPVEGDFTRAAAQPLPPDLVVRQQAVNRRADFLTPLWFALLGAVAMASWPGGPWRRSRA